MSADGVGTNEIMRRTGKSKTCVWRWQERFMQAGYDGLLRDKTRPSRIPPLGSDIAERVVVLTQTDPPAEATHWTATMMAKAVGISASSVQRIWRTHDFHRPRGRWQRGRQNEAQSIPSHSPHHRRPEAAAQAKCDTRVSFAEHQGRARASRADREASESERAPRSQEARGRRTK